MSKVFTEFRVFVASPSGLEAERKAFRDTLLEYNAEVRNRSILFTPVGWEETLGGHRRPQDLINKDLVTCDYFVLSLWDRWGSPPGPPGRTNFSSGCEEEFELALNCLEPCGVYSLKIDHSGFLQDFQTIEFEELKPQNPWEASEFAPAGLA